MIDDEKARETELSSSLVAMIRRSTVAPSCEEALTAAKIEDASLHSLRHTFASHLVMSGVDIVTVSKLLGHATIQMTMRYSHLSPEHQARAVSVLDGVFSLKSRKIDTNRSQDEVCAEAINSEFFVS